MTRSICLLVYECMGHCSSALTPRRRAHAWAPRACVHGSRCACARVCLERARGLERAPGPRYGGGKEQHGPTRATATCLHGGRARDQVRAAGRAVSTRSPRLTREDRCLTDSDHGFKPCRAPVAERSPSLRRDSEFAHEKRRRSRLWAGAHFKFVSACVPGPVRANFERYYAREKARKMAGAVCVVADTPERADARQHTPNCTASSDTVKRTRAAP
jgi:hypothetical protein